MWTIALRILLKTCVMTLRIAEARNDLWMVTTGLFFVIYLAIAAICSSKNCKCLDAEKSGMKLAVTSSGSLMNVF